MKLIAHRGLVAGPNLDLENNPVTIQSCLYQGYDAEVDLWVKNDVLILGHDEPTYPIGQDFIKQPGLWIHAKNDEACFWLSSQASLNYFWHESDARVLTSKGIWWTYPGQSLGDLSVAVMPENHVEDLSTWAKLQTCYGICSDFVSLMKG